MKNLRLATTALCLCLTSATAQASCVILLHGLARTISSMETLADHLTVEGYQVVNLGYPSRAHPIEELTRKAIPPALKACGDTAQVNFVTHSLGGILVRQYLSVNTIPNLNHTVMLGPPNQGSEIIDTLKNTPGFHALNGDAGMQLGTEPHSIPNSLGPANFDVGIIAGNKTINWILSLLIPGSDDGKVSIKSTRLQGMNDHIELAVTHPFMMKNKKVMHQVSYYLKHGKFEHRSNE